MTRIRIQYRGVVTALFLIFSYVITVLTLRTTEALRSISLSSSSSRQYSRIKTTTATTSIGKRRRRSDDVCRWSTTTRTATERNDDDDAAVAVAVVAAASSITNTISLRKSSGAPVVDSTLLRFISQQQKQLSPDIFAVAKAADETNKVKDDGDDSATTIAKELKTIPITTAETPSPASTESSSAMKRISSPQTTVAAAASTAASTKTKMKMKMKRKKTIQTAQIQSLADSLLSSFTALPTTMRKTVTTPPRSSNTDNNNNVVTTTTAEAATAMMMEEETTVAQKTNTEQQQPPPPSSFSSSSSSSQFSSKNIVQALLLNGDGNVNDDQQQQIKAAKCAGDAIERYVVVRTARRRIRRFLKERDTLWDEVNNASGSSSSSSRQELESLAASAAALSPAASLLLSYGDEQPGESTDDDDDNDNDNDSDSSKQKQHNFQDVITIMKEYGLTFNDICILLTHSPNLALRVPRKSKIEIETVVERIEIANNGEAAVQAARAAVAETNTNTNTNIANEQYAESLEETLDRSFKGLLQTTLGLRRYDARKVLRGCPNLLSVRGSKSACQIIVIMNKTGVSYSSLARDKNGLPTLLSRSPAGLFKLISFLSSTAVRMPINQIGPLIRKRTSLLMDAVNPIPLPTQTASLTIVTTPNNDNVNGNNVEATTTSEGNNANDGDDDDGDDEAVRSISRKARDITAERKKEIENTYRDMTRTSLILQKQIGSKDLSRLVAAYPQVLLLDAEKQILPVARYLMGGLGIWEDDLSSLLQLYPTLLGKRIDDLEKIVSYLVDELGVNEDDLGTIFRSFPVLFSLSIENDMKPVVEYLKENCGIGNNKDMLGSFITRLPPVLGYNVTTEIQPKWEYLKKITLRPEWELNAFPAYFSYPFNRVIQTRFNYLSYKGMFWFTTSKIDTVLRYGDIDFATKIALDSDNGKSYKEFGQKQRTSSSKGGTAIKQKPWRTTKKKSNHKSKASLAARSGGRGNTPDDVIRNLNADIKKSFRTDSKKYKRRRKAAEAATAKAAAIASDEEVKAKKAASSSSSKKTTTSTKTKTKTKKSQKHGRRQGEGDDGTATSMAVPSPA